MLWWHRVTHNPNMEALDLDVNVTSSSHGLITFATCLPPLLQIKVYKIWPSQSLDSNQTENLWQNWNSDVHTVWLS